MVESFEKLLDVADVYAQALFELAQESGQIDAVRQELDELVRLARSEQQLGAFFTSRALDDDRRKAIMEKTLRGRVSDLVLNTLLVTYSHGRSGLLEALCRCYALRQEEAAGQVEATATSAVPLEEPQRRAVTELAARLSARKPLVDFRVDPGVLGGLILQIGDIRYDNSLRRHLNVARHRLAERSERGLEVSVVE
jgi:F-type H+-transporting ATPase subunit delta